MTAARKRLRVLFVIDHAGARGGAERFVAGLAMHMPSDRIEPWVCSTRQGAQDAVEALAAAGVPHTNLGRRAKWDVHRVLRLGPLLRRERFDVLHAHKFGSNLWGSLIGRACRVPVIITHEHNWAYAGSRLRVLLDRAVIARLATRFVAVSEANRTSMIEIEGINPAKVLVMPTAYIPHEAAAHGDIRAELGLSSDAPLIGVAAGLRPEKALDVMLEAHAKVRRRVETAHLIIAGEGSCLAALRQHAQRLGIEDSVHFLGLRRDVDALMRAVDVGAMSSDWEGMPLFVFECMAAGTPLVATSVGGVPEIVRHSSGGLLVPPQDPDALAEALSTVLSDRSVGERMAAEAAARLHEFQIEVVAARFADLYEQLTLEARTR